MNASKLKKLTAVTIVAALSTGLSFLLKFSADSMREKMIETANLGEILAQIKEADVNVKILAGVLQEPPPVLPIFIISIVCIAITVWLYHKILNYLCKSNKNPNESSEPTLKTPGDPVDG